MPLAVRGFVIYRMMREKILSYYNERCSEISHFPGKKADLNHRSTHKIRVAIKKLRAIMILVERFAPHGLNAKHSYKPLKKLFKPLGQLREIQLMKTHPKFLPARQNKDMLTAFLTKKEKALQKKVRQALDRFDLSYFKKTRKKIKKLLDEFEEDALTRAFNEFILTGIESIEHPVITSREKLHRLRRDLKQIIYLLDIQNPLLKKKQIELKKKEKMIGEWHDWKVYSEDISAFKGLKKILPIKMIRDKERKLYHKIISTLR